jgi:hypothetical protein
MKTALLPTRKDMIEEKVTGAAGTPPTRDFLIARYQFTPEQLKSKPVKRFLLYKLSLDAEILKLLRAHRGERLYILSAIAAEFGLTVGELKRAPNLEQAIKSIIDSISYKAQLEYLTKRVVPATKPLTPTYPPTKEQK